MEESLPVGYPIPMVILKTYTQQTLYSSRKLYLCIQEHTHTHTQQKKKIYEFESYHDGGVHRGVWWRDVNGKMIKLYYELKK